MTGLHWDQIRAVIRLEMRKTFFAKRGLWVYLLALAPLVLFLGHAVAMRFVNLSRSHLAARNEKPLSSTDFAAIQEGMSRDEVIARLGRAPISYEHTRHSRNERDEREEWQEQIDRYSDGQSDYRFTYRDGKLAAMDVHGGCDFGRDSIIFATTFQLFYLRLAVFFGCLGIFMNLFRGELLDKSLHFYFLAPIRREVLLAGKYLAGLIASVVIYTTSTALQLFVMGWHLDSNSVSNFLYHNHGVAHIAAYLGVTVLACVGYGSVFLAAGLLFRNPIFPAAVILIWESITPFLPALLKKFSVIYYLTSLCPLSIPVDSGAPSLFTMLVSNPDPIAAPAAVLGLVVLAVLILFLATRSVRHLEINYTTE
jgi:ABC-type transport system involved in multi-copper enzyme maturation permease subunit